MPSRTVWLDTTINTDLTSGGSSGLTNLMAGMSDEQIRTTSLTLLRTIIRLDVAATVHDAGEGSQRVSLGIGVASSDAAALGVTALPDPENMSDFPPRGRAWRAQYHALSVPSAVS